MVWVADDDDLVAVGLELLGLHVNLRYHRAGGVDDLEVLRFGLLEDVDGKAVRADEERAGINVIDDGGVLEAAGGQRLDHLRIVDDVSERRNVAARGDRLLGFLYRDGNPEAEALDGCLTNFHRYSPPTALLNS